MPALSGVGVAATIVEIEPCATTYHILIPELVSFYMFMKAIFYESHLQKRMTVELLSMISEEVIFSISPYLKIELKIKFDDIF